MHLPRQLEHLASHTYISPGPAQVKHINEMATCTGDTNRCALHTNELNVLKSDLKTGMEKNKACKHTK
jgi:hypothetical protein